jgi:hypothetical protein
MTAQEKLSSVFLMGWCRYVCYFPYEPGLESDILARQSLMLSRIRCPMLMLCSTMADSVSFDVVFINCGLAGKSGLASVHFPNLVDDATLCRPSALRPRSTYMG